MSAFDWDAAYQERCTKFARWERAQDSDRIEKAIAKRNASATTTVSEIVGNFADRLKSSNRTMMFASESAGSGASDGTLTLELFGEIDTEKEIDIVGACHANPRASELVLFIDSRGGMVEPAENIAIAIGAHPAKRKRALIVGDCASAAVLVALMFVERLGTQNAVIQPHRTYWADGKKEADAHVSCKASDLIEMTMAKARGIRREVWQNIRDADSPVGLDEAIELGLLTGRHTGTLPTPTIPKRVVNIAPDDGISDTYRIVTVSGESADLLMPKETVRSLAKAMQSQQFGEPLHMNFPCQIMDEAERIAGRRND